MAFSFPATYYACPCSDLTSAPIPATNKRASFQPTTIQLTDDQTFNPHSPRANYALYPLEHLLYCDECDVISCPRCWTEEVLYWYCPSCLFEVPSSAVRGDGNRCSRSCYNCPSCTSPLAVTQINGPREEALPKPSDAASGNESYILQCQYCDWTSLEIDVQFNKATKITEQLAKIWKSRSSSEEENESPDRTTPSHNEIFANLATFYKEQLSGAGDAQNPYSNSPYSSPANLARIMSLYGGLPYNALKKSREKPQPMREALQQSEGLSKISASDSDTSVIRKMSKLGWDHTISTQQQSSTPFNYGARFTNELWPVATPLRTRRGRRCKSCRQFLSRPEQKVGSTKYKIRLLAVNYIPRLSIRPLHPSTPTTNPAFHLQPDPPEQETLRPFQTRQYILTIRNPIFESVRVSLATPATTPGRVASRVTILCPSFNVGPAGAIWDDALASSAQSSTNDGGRNAAMASLTGSAEGSVDRQPEAGKIWEKSRNSTSVIVEIVPGSLHAALPSIVGTPTDQQDDEEWEEDDDVLEVPIYVRAEWEVDVKPDETGASLKGRKDGERTPGERAKKELGYWVVLGVGRIAP